MVELTEAGESCRSARRDAPAEPQTFKGSTRESSEDVRSETLQSIGVCSPYIHIFFRVLFHGESSFMFRR